MDEVTRSLVEKWNLAAAKARWWEDQLRHQLRGASRDLPASLGELLHEYCLRAPRLGHEPGPDILEPYSLRFARPGSTPD